MSGKSVTLYVPTINDNLPDFNKLFSLWKQLNQDGLQATFDFSKCFFLRQNAVAFIGGLIRMIQRRGGMVCFNLESLRADVRKNVEENGFLGTLGFGGTAARGNSIPYREDDVHEKDVLVDYLRTQWLGRGWINITGLLMDAIVGRVLEIYDNAFEHGNSPVGVFSCGQHFPRRRELNLTVVDFGVGIPSNVRYHLQNSEMTGSDCMKWASTRGNTTKPKQGIPGGVGLDLLREFVMITGGRLEIFSHEGYALFKTGQERFLSTDSYFEGTLVNIKLHCDPTLYYRLATEPEAAPLF